MSHSQLDKLHAMRHSMAHITAAAVKRIWPKAKFGVGPVVDSGYYYDIDVGEHKISEDDFKHIEAEIKNIITENQPFEHFTMPIADAVKWAEDNHQPYKLELLHDLQRQGTTLMRDLDPAALGVQQTDGDSRVDKVSFYRNGEFVDLCRGPHVSSTGEVSAYKLMRVAGAYWRGKESNPQMQRLYGVAFDTKEQLNDYLTAIDEAKKRDHRKLGKDLDLYTISPLVGAGLPLFTPRGTLLKDKLTAYAEQLRRDSGFQRVSIPHITKTDLYKISGHWDKFGDELFLVQSQETSDDFALKPMNCPHHNQIYASKPRSYKDLPLRYVETTTVYRDEKTGELGGLSRVRSITQDDSHVYCSREQLEDEIAVLVKDVQSLYDKFGMTLKARLSFRDDSDAYLGDKDLWSDAQAIIAATAKKLKLDYFTAQGEAAFYGPKIDFMARDALGREHQVATVQLDFIMPDRFSLEYTGKDGATHRPVMVHCALLGSVERFMSVFIEHCAGWFPFWMAPEQIRIVTINDTVDEYVKKITDVISTTLLMEPVRYNELRFTVDNRNESLGKKMRDALDLKIPVVIVVGPKDVAANQVSLRIKNNERVIGLNELKTLLQQIG